jgi:2-dehydropantoate 2-reductase
MKALVVGGGAVGSLLAWVLAAAGVPTTIVRRRAARSEVRELTVIGPGRTTGRAVVNIVRSTEDVEFEPSIVALAVKAFDLPDAVDSLPAFDRATFVTVQNGIGSEEAAIERRPGNPLIAASLTASVDLETEDRLRWLRRGGIGLSTVRPGSISVNTIALMLDEPGLPARVYPDWRAMKWSKLIANLVGNATSALVDVTVSEVYAHPGLFEIERRQLREASAVIRALGLKPVSLPGASVAQLGLGLELPGPVARPILGFAVGGGRGGKDPSLRLAMAAGATQTEVGWLNGAVAGAGAELGVPTPVNAALTALVDQAAGDPARREALRRRPDALIDAIAAFGAAGDTAVAPQETSR